MCTAVSQHVRPHPGCASVLSGIIFGVPVPNIDGGYVAACVYPDGCTRCHEIVSLDLVSCSEVQTFRRRFSAGAFLIHFCSAQLVMVCHLLWYWSQAVSLGLSLTLQSAVCLPQACTFCCSKGSPSQACK